MSIFDKLMGPLFGGGSANSSGAVSPTSPTKTQAILTGLFGAQRPQVPQAPKIPIGTMDKTVAGSEDPMPAVNPYQNSGPSGTPLSTDQFTNLQAVLKAIQGN